MLYRQILVLALSGWCSALGADSFQIRIAQSPGAVLGRDGVPLPAGVVLSRSWEGEVCHSAIENRGPETVNVGSVILAEFAHGLPADTAVYGEGFTMLSQTGGTLACPVDEGFYTDRGHYRIPEPQGRRTVYGMLTLRPAVGRHILLAFTSARRFVGRFSFDTNTISVSCDGEGLVLAPGERWELEPLLVLEGSNRAGLLERLAAELNRNHPPIFRPPVPTGWCSWYCFGPDVTASQIRGNLSWAKEHFPSLRYIQIDDGYQPWMGDWLETGKSFGGDVRSVLREIRAEGFEPAIWVAPFVASPQSRLFREHPDWFVQDTNGRPLRSDMVGFGGWRLGPWYVLDGTHPGAQGWLENLFRTLRGDWGCSYFKLDAIYWGAIHGGVHHDRKATRVEAYRRGMEAIRRGAGDAFILGCNHPIWPSLGLIHGSRSSMDVNRDWHHFAKTGRENLLRGWQNGRIWWNDPDALCLSGTVLEGGPETPGLVKSIGKASDDELLFHATLVYATGGMLMVGDDMRTYREREKARLAVLCPPAGRAMVFEDDAFEVGRLQLPAGEMVAVLNWQDVPRDFSVSLPGRVRVAEIWSGHDLGLQADVFKLSAVPPHSGRLYRMVPASGVPATGDTALQSGKEPISRHVVVVGVDGLRTDSFVAAKKPHLDALMKTGAHSLRAVSSIGQPTISGPAWSSILTGVWASKHGVQNNEFAGHRFELYPSFLARAKQHLPSVTTASIVNWAPINQHIPHRADYEMHGLKDADVTSKVIQLIRDKGPHILFVQLDELDGAGHRGGYHPGNPAYLEAFTVVDGHVGAIAGAVRERKNTHLGESWLIIVVSDHGGTAAGKHGGDSPEEVLVPYIIWGDGVVQGEFVETIYNVDVAVTALAWLGISINPDWNLDGHVRGIVPAGAAAPR